MDIFTKCYQHSFVDELRERDLFPYFRELQSRQDTEVIMEGKRRIMLGSNNYLGLTTNPEIIAAAHKALDEYGTGCSGSRLLNGTLNLHLAFEREMAELARIEQIDWSRPAVVGESPLPAGYGFQVRDIRYAHATRSYTVLLQTAEQYLGDMAGFQAQLGELEDTLQEKQALLQEQESMIAALEQAGSAAQLRSELEDAYQKGVELCG